MQKQTLWTSVLMAQLVFGLVACGGNDNDSQTREQHAGGGDIGDTSEIDGMNLTAKEKNQIKGDLSSLVKRQPALEADLADMVKKCSNFDSDLTAAKASLGGIAAEQIALENKVANLKLAKASVEGQLNAVQGKMSSLKGEIETLKDAAASVGPNYKTRLNASMKAIATEISSFKTKKAGLEKDLDKAIDEGNADKIETIAIAIADVTDAISANEAKKASVATLLKFEKTAVKKDLDAQIDAKKAEHKTYVAEHSSEVSSFKTALRKVSRELGSAGTELKRFTSAAALKVAVLPVLCQKLLK